MPRRAETGQWGEAIAAKYLREQGYEILARNWRHGHGEIDLIVRKTTVIAFVEVRTRHGDAYGAPEETLTARKRAKVVQTAEMYLAAHNLQEADWRIDFIAIELDARHAVQRFEHFEGEL